MIFAILVPRCTSIFYLEKKSSFQFAFISCLVEFTTFSFRKSMCMPYKIPNKNTTIIQSNKSFICQQYSIGVE